MPDRATFAAFRFGFGLPEAADTPEALLAGLAGADEAAARWPGVTTPEVLDVLAEIRAAREMRTDDDEGKAARKAQRRAVRKGNALAQRGMQAAFARAVGGAPLRERLARFWTDHFTVISKSRTDRAWPAALVDEAIRPHLGGRFADMLAAVVTHPAMLIYLDQVNSTGPNSPRGERRGRGLNENLARELLELHTLGVGGGYGQEDVREMAELLTGLAFAPERGFVFDEARVEPGDDVVLGVSYGGAGIAPIRAVLEDLAVHPATARHLAGKLAVHFVSDAPDPALVAAIESEWLRTGGDLTAVAAALLAHPAAWEGPLVKARQPFDFVAASLRALGLTGDEIHRMGEEPFRRMIGDPLAGMGQPFGAPGGPDGWPEEEEAWITPAGLAARITWAMEVPGRLVSAMPEPAALMARALGGLAGERLAFAVGAAESRREAVGLVFAAPEFNRR